MMNGRRSILHGVLAGLGWAWLGLGLAEAAPVAPTDPTTLKLSSDTSVTVSIYQLDSTLPSTVTLGSPTRCTTTGTQFYRDVTDCWLPEWNPTAGGKSVYVVINGSVQVPTLVPPLSPAAFTGAANPFLVPGVVLTTSAYPGQCGNVGSGSDPDFVLDATATTLATSATTSVVGYKLTPTDCGGMAVIQAGTLKFILPRDGTTSIAANGLPEAWENLFGGGLDPAGDIDTGPSATSPIGDGVSTFDEYRGAIVSGKQIRTDPTQKDLYLKVMNPADTSGGAFVVSTSCGASCVGGGTLTYPTPTAPNATLTLPSNAASSLGVATFTANPGVFTTANVGGEIIGNAGGRARIVSVAGPTGVTAEVTQLFPAGATLAAGSWKLTESLFAIVYTLVPPERLHILGYTPGGTNPTTTTEWRDQFISIVPAQTLTIGDTVADRTMNPNRVYGLAQKGVRVMEGLNTDSPSILGYSFGVASPNQAGNVIVFTQRIINYITGTLIGTATSLKYSTASIVNGAWTWSTAITVPDGDPTTTSGDGVATNADVRNFIISKALQFYVAMEVHHSLDLTPDIQGTSRTSYGHHFAPGTGDCLDQAITTTAKSGVVTFYIPSLCGSADQASFVIR